MKKAFYITSVVGLILLAACSEKELLKNIEGTWKVSRYTVDDKDRTRYFDTTFKQFKWQFTKDNKFNKTWQYRIIDTSLIISVIFDSVTSAGDTIRHYDTVKTTSPKFVPAKIMGDWYLTNSNKFLQTRDSVNGTALYKIEEHAGSEMHLSKGNEYWILKQ